ncbi:Peptide methionine sulfoxide reductase MsrA [Clostridiaceae bacterium JG1575]|nr:Peptide methionine sulfoxide reductase MsrA [Clostridiaceae bacterium JG1575]
MKSIVVAGGCFWGVEAWFKRQPFVKSTTVGYANSSIENPDYKLVCTGSTGAVEAVRIEYEGPLGQVLDALYKVIDPTAFNRQGPDVGTQYRTGIYYEDEADREAIEKSLNTLSEKLQKPLATEALPLANFWPAEAYHQDYLDKNPTGYCHINLNQPLD